MSHRSDTSDPNVCILSDRSNTESQGRFRVISTDRWPLLLRSLAITRDTAFWSHCKLNHTGRNRKKTPRQAAYPLTRNSTFLAFICN